MTTTPKAGGKVRLGRAKENPAALRLSEWYDHVARTPVGMVPQILNGVVFMYGFATATRWTTAALIEHFTGAAPRHYWPSWARDLR